MWVLIPLTKMNLKLIKDLNMIPKTAKLLKENIVVKFLDIGWQ